MGSFHQPKEVHIDTGFLNTLPERVKRDGMGEVVKYNMIGNISLDSPIEEIIYNCVRLKGEIVAEDEKDRGIRKILNYGHTIGHAIEKLTDYSVYTHGEAVAMGMFAAACVGEKLGFPSYIREYLKETLINYSLPWKMPDTDSHVLEDLISHDKKMSAGKIDMVVLEDIGRPIICPLTPKEIVLCLN
ncbi:MAG: hypothetical protein KBT47_00015 [Armatimonadetes bacterium]|nr:hypothetical protein [Candidatus Hippobium faecium]